MFGQKTGTKKAQRMFLAIPYRFAIQVLLATTQAAVESLAVCKADSRDIHINKVHQRRQHNENNTQSGVVIHDYFNPMFASSNSQHMFTTTQSKITHRHIFSSTRVCTSCVCMLTPTHTHNSCMNKDAQCPHCHTDTHVNYCYNY